jgi:hypothetical protein
MKAPLVLIAAFALGMTGAARASLVDLVDVAQLSARSTHACVVTTTGGVKCWGSNSNGQLGGGPADTTRDAASDVVGLASGSGVIAVAASTGAHTCAILAGGSVKCWGANGNGQLGDATTMDHGEPVDVVGLQRPAVALSGGGAHTCALLDTGAVACWGSNALGQLGDGTTSDRHAPTPVAGLSGSVTAISAALSHTCAIVAGGGVQCWGAVYAPPSSVGSATPQPVPADVAGLASGVTWIVTDGIGGGTFDPARGGGCAVASGIGQCWSQDSTATAPAAISGLPTGVAAIARAGWAQAVPINRFNFYGYGCALSGGGIKCWGTNYCGVLGDGSAPVCSGYFYPNATTPTDVVGLSSGVASIAVAPFFACALSTDHSVKCWGSGYGSTPVAPVEGTSSQAIYLQAAPQGLAVGGTAPLLVWSSGGSGNPVVFGSLTPLTCSVSGSTVTGVGGGTCTVAANQAGSVYYDPAPQVTLSFPVDPRLAQQIVFTAPATLAIDAIATLVATSTSGRPVNISLNYSNDKCSLSGRFLRGTVLGSCGVVASLPGDAVYAPAQSITRYVQIVDNAGTRGLAVYTTGGGSGTVASVPAGIDCGPACAGNFATGSTVALTATASSGSTFTGWSGACSGTGPCMVTMDAVKAVDANFASDTPRMANLSTRGWVSGGNDALIGGFVIGGTANKTVVVRARGPSLGAFGITNALADPALRLVRSSDQVLIAYNESMFFDTLLPNDGNARVRNAEAIQNLGFGVSDPREAAILITLSPGAYTAIVTPDVAYPNPGVGLFEVFEVDAAGQPLINVSTRGTVGAGNEVLIAGFIIQGSGPQAVVVRGRGPSLAAFGVADALANPTLRLVRSSDQASIAINDDWESAPNASAISASGFAPSNALESAILVTLEPGAYTAILGGVGGTGGTGIVEVFRSGN